MATYNEENRLQKIKSHYTNKQQLYNKMIDILGRWGITSPKVYILSHMKFLVLNKKL